MMEPSLATLLETPKGSSPPAQAPLLAASSLSTQIETAFTYHPPKGNQAERYARLRDCAKELAGLIDRSCPHSRERALAVTNLENCVMWANASIARNE